MSEIDEAREEAIRGLVDAIGHVKSGAHAVWSIERLCRAILSARPPTPEAERPGTPCATCGKCPCYEHERVTVMGPAEKCGHYGVMRSHFECAHCGERMSYSGGVTGVGDSAPQANDTECRCGHPRSSHDQHGCFAHNGITCSCMGYRPESDPSATSERTEDGIRISERGDRGSEAARGGAPGERGPDGSECVPGDSSVGGRAGDALGEQPVARESDTAEGVARPTSGGVPEASDEELNATAEAARSRGGWSTSRERHLKQYRAIYEAGRTSLAKRIEAYERFVSEVRARFTGNQYFDLRLEELESELSAAGTK